MFCLAEDMISIPVSMLREMQQTVQRQANTISTMGEQITQMTARIEELTQMLRNAQRARFGQHSE